MKQYKSMSGRGWLAAALLVATGMGGVQAAQYCPTGAAVMEAGRESVVVDVRRTSANGKTCLVRVRGERGESWVPASRLSNVADRGRGSARFDGGHGPHWAHRGASVMARGHGGWTPARVKEVRGRQALVAYETRHRKDEWVELSELRRR